MRRKTAIVALGVVLLLGYLLAVLATRETRFTGLRGGPTAIVTDDGRRLAGFFDGLTPHPRFEPKRMRAELEATATSTCAVNGDAGLLGRLRELVEPTARAQSNCYATSCTGEYRRVQEIRPCAPPACPGGYNNTYADYANGQRQNGFRQTATEGCSRDAQQYPGVLCACNQEICLKPCSSNYSCPDGQHCSGGSCRDSNCPLGEIEWCESSGDCVASARVA
jgi:hypothetical protein